MLYPTTKSSSSRSSKMVFRTSSRMHVSKDMQNVFIAAGDMSMMAQLSRSILWRTKKGLWWAVFICTVINSKCVVIVLLCFGALCNAGSAVYGWWRMINDSDRRHHTQSYATKKNVMPKPHITQNNSQDNDAFKQNQTLSNKQKKKTILPI